MKSNNININHIRYFIKVFETQSLSKAAKACGVSQPTISKSIQTLEKNFGIPLFHRDTQNVHPSEPAKLVYNECLDLCRSADMLQKRVENIKLSDLGEVKIGIGKLLSNQFGSFLMKVFPEHFPNLRLSVTDGNVPELNTLLLNREVDFLLCYHEAQHYFTNLDKICVKEFFNVRVSHVVSPNAPFYQPGKDITTYPWAITSEVGDEAKKTRWTEFYNKLIESGNINYRINNNETRLQLVRKGAVVTAVPSFLVREEIKRGELIDVTPPGLDSFQVSVFTLNSNPLSINSKKTLAALQILTKELH
ncbi:LysR family transcriptional regulator [Vibrio sp. S4M6]|uniref:LysR family transcriptional regulator n=1 Tax=Vibrio sinus TaxID=2946865 RepID=UPI002029B90F|nr:LysR family transcriptional regulator [Vibrio sinus]MCL9780863.1 LysR family transcriptional regulator [Vibrio sinus]